MIKIIPYNKKYGSETVKMWRTSKGDTLAIDDIYDEASYLSFLNDVLIKECKVLIALNDNIIVGMMAYNDRMIDQLYIDGNSQGSGIGSTLIEKAKSEAKQLELYVFQKNERAIIFYKHHGFEIVELSSENEENLLAYKMIWEL